MTDMNELNDEIRRTDLLMLARRMLANDNRTDIDLAKHEYKNTLDKAQYSNEQKREIAAEQEPTIKALVQTLEEYEYETKRMQIAQEHNKRQLDILLAVQK